jgi:hypothetical protein
MPDSAPPKPDVVVKALAPDPTNVPDLRVLGGFAGPSSRKDHARIYISFDLSRYVDVPVNAILHSVSLETEDDPTGGTVVWVRRDANLISSVTETREAQSDFLTGSLNRGRGRTVAMNFGIAGRGPLFGPFSLIPPCPGDGGGGGGGTLLFCPSLWKGPCFAAG